MIHRQRQWSIQETTRHSIHPDDNGKFGFQYVSGLGKLCSGFPCGVSFEIIKKIFFFLIVWRTRSFWFMWILTLCLLQKKITLFVVIPFIFIVYLLCTLTTSLTEWMIRFDLRCAHSSLLANIYFHLMINLSSPTTLHFSIHYLIISGRQFSFSRFLSHHGMHTIAIRSTIQSVQFIINVRCWMKNHKFIIFML